MRRQTNCEVASVTRMCHQLNIWNTGRILMIARVLFLFCPPFIAGISLSPCGGDDVYEVQVDQETHFICTAERPVEWKLLLNKTTSAHFLGICDKECVQLDTVNELFIIRAIDARTSAMIVKPGSNPLLYNNIHYLNGSLECSQRDVDNLSAWCGLNYVDPPKNVSCTATNFSWSVHVTCAVGSVFSSRKSYYCQLIRVKNTSNNETLQIVTMLTSPTSEKITKSEVKVSGSCQFSTTLPPKEGLYGFYVSVSPGGQHFSASDKRFAVERPRSPTVSCGPQPCVLENTAVVCTCRTTSLGQPAGYLIWIIGNQTNRERYVKTDGQAVTSKELNYTKSLILSDHGRTWFICDLIWGNETVWGASYTACVRQATRTLRFSVNDREGNVTVTEGHTVHLRCESDGRPTPNVSIYNNDNDTDISKGSSPLNYTFTSRCEDTALYTCSAYSEFSHHVNTSLIIGLGVMCKPQIISSANFGNIKVKGKRHVLNFDVIAFPAPDVFGLWCSESTIINSEPSCADSSEVIASCSSDRKYRYLSKCTLSMFRNASQSWTGFYKVMVTNGLGEESFTVEISESEEDKVLQERYFPLWGFVAGGIIFITAVAVLIIVIRKTVKDSYSVSSASQGRGGGLVFYIDSRTEIISRQSSQPCKQMFNTESMPEISELMTGNLHCIGDRCELLHHWTAPSPIDKSRQLKSPETGGVQLAGTLSAWHKVLPPSDQLCNDP